MGAGGFVTGITQADGKFISVVAGSGVYPKALLMKVKDT